MQNIKTKKKNIVNRMRISHLKTLIKKAKNENDANAIYAMADSLSCKHIIHKNKANRIKSKIAKKFIKQKKNNKINENKA